MSWHPTFLVETMAVILTTLTAAVSLVRERPRGICIRTDPQWTMLRNEGVDHRLDKCSTHMNKSHIDQAPCDSPHPVPLGAAPELPM